MSRLKPFVGSVCFAMALSLSPALAVAEEMTFKPYLELGPGLYFLNTNTQTSGSAKTKMLGGFVAAGVDLDWGFPLLLGLQLRASGSAKDSTTLSDGNAIKSRVKIPLWSAFFVPRYEITDDWRIHALLGATQTPDYTLHTVARVTTTSNVKTSFSYGVGTDYRVTDSIRVGAEWTRYHDRISASSSVDVALSSVNLTLSYTFGDDKRVVAPARIKLVEKQVAVIVEEKPEPMPVVEAIPVVVAEPEPVKEEVMEQKTAPVSEPVLVEDKAVDVTGVPVVAAVVVASETKLQVAVSLGNIRLEPNLQSTVLHRLKRGANVTRLKVEGEWYRVRLGNGVEAWAHESLF